ncbi:unnamed protein product [Durusdinium trenchii]|uniref:Major facilitator superfamily associated domain-containing protein n=2 Tax=Durusdinium trenchii TaxID=1381693 RepID=A0ABP0K9D3_9DINO
MGQREKLQVCSLVVLQFFSGFAWAVQRPQGFFVVLLEQHGFSGSAIGLISSLGLFTPTLTGPLVGFAADALAPEQRHRLFAGVALLKSTLQLAAWPALADAPSSRAYWWIFSCMCLQAACSQGGMLTEITLRFVGKETYGKVRLWGGIGFASGSLLTGLLAHHLGYSIVFLESMFVGVALATSVFCLAHASVSAAPGSEMLHVAAPSEPTSERSRRPSTKELLRFLLTPRVAVMLIIVVAMGFCEGIMQTYTYVRLQELPYGSSTIMSLSAVCMIISEVPFFYFADPIVRRFGIMPILSFSLLCSALRQGWISFLWDARWVLPGELLHGITFSIANAAVTLSAHDLAAGTRFETTMQSVIGSCWVGIGQGSASWAGGLVLHHAGPVALFQASALLALVSSLLPLGLALCDRQRPRCDAA